MHGRNEVTSTLTFNDEDWEAIFGTEDEVDDAKEPSPNSEPDAEKRKQDVESKSVAKVISTKNNSEIPTIYSRCTACSSTNPITSIGNSGISLSVQRTRDTVDPVKQTQVVVMDLCMKREQKLRAEGNIIEANALSAVGFSIMNLMAKVMELLQSNESIHAGSLMLEAIKASMNKGSDEWESLVLCAGSIHALIDEVQMKSAGLNGVEQLEMINETKKKLDKEERATKLANERKKRKWEAVYAKKQEEANKKRKCRAMQRTESQSFLYPPTHQAEHYMEASDGGGSAILMAANKFKVRKEERRKQIKKKSQIIEERKCLPQSNVSDTSLQVMPNLPDDKSFTGPISAEALMEEYEESDSSNSITLPTFPVQGDANRHCLQRSPSFALSSTEAPTKCRLSNHIENNLPVTEKANCPSLASNISNQSTASSRSSVDVKISSPSGRSQLDTGSTNTTNPIRAKFVTQLARKYGNLNFVKIRKAGAKLNDGDKLRPKGKNVLFAAESKYSVIEISNDPNATTDVVDLIGFSDYRKKYPRGSAIMPEEWKRKEVEKLPPREYNFFLGSTISRPVGSINARSFCESCEFARGDIRNWFIVGSRFDRLNESVFDVKKSGCPKTHLSHVNYPPIHFRILSDALTHISINVAGLKIFLAVGEDWIVKNSLMPEEFTSFIRKFAGVLYELYIKEYTLEHKKEVEFAEDLEKLRSGYAYVEMPTVILFTIPASSDSDTEMKCEFYNSAIRELIRNWDVTWTSPYYHNATKQCIELKLIDWRQICINENANSSKSMITVLMKHLMEEWGVCMTPTNRS